MTYQLEMGDDGILRLSFSGQIGTEEMEAFRQDFMPFLEAATDESPVLVLSGAHGDTKYSSGARKIFMQLNRDPRIGKAATVGTARYTRVLARFVLKATGRDNIGFFDTQEEAVAWLKDEA